MMVVLLPLLMVEQGAAVTYFVAANGSDANSGMAQEVPWQTMAKVNASRFAPGDLILFRRGDAWAEKLVISSSGTPENPITFGAFGSGDGPVLDVKGIDANVIAVYASNLTIQDFILKNSSNNALGISPKNGFSGKIMNLTIHNAGNNGISLSSGGVGVVIDRCRIFNSANNGVMLLGSLSNKLSRVVVRDCLVSKTTGNDCFSVHEGEGGTAGEGFLFVNNHAEYCHEQGFDITSGEKVILLENQTKGNVAGGITVAHSASNVTVRRHLSREEPTMPTSAAISFTAGQNHRLYESVILDSGYHSLRVGASNIYICNNTIRWGGSGEIMDVVGVIDGLVVKNNLFLSDRADGGRIRFLDPSRPPGHPTFALDNNLYHGPGGLRIFVKASDTQYDFDNYRTTSKQEVHGLAVDPGVINITGGDFHLRPESVAIDHGAFYTATTRDGQGRVLPVVDAGYFVDGFGLIRGDLIQVGVKAQSHTATVLQVDYNRNELTLDTELTWRQGDAVSLAYVGAAPDMGAFEHGGANPPWRLPAPVLHRVKLEQ